MKSLAAKIFLLILFFILLPIYVSFLIIKISYERYLSRELSGRVSANIRRGEEELYDTLHTMANISNVFVGNEDLLLILDNPGADYYSRNRRFDSIVNTIYVNNLFDLNNVKITLLDTSERVYGNWSLNFNDYRFLLSESWVKESIQNKTHISWSLFSPSFVKQESEQYISLARSLLLPFPAGERVGTLLVSLNQRKINAILSKYGMETDFVYICTRDTMEEVFTINKVHAAGYSDIRPLVREIADGGRGSRRCELEGGQYLMTYFPLDTPWSFNGQPLLVLHFTDYQYIDATLAAFSRDINYGMIVFLLVLMIIMLVISRTIARPIKILNEHVKYYTLTREIKKISVTGNDEIGNLSRSFTDMETRINELFDKLKRESEIREQYRFRALRSQINPHFLFNTLNTIRWMAMIRGADNITEAMDALIKMLEYSIRGEREFVRLGDELDMIRNYLCIQNYRYGEDFTVNIEIPKTMEQYRIIKFILQPVVENAFLHAFKNFAGKKIIVISGREEPGKIRLTVKDNGRGMSEEKAAALNDRIVSYGEDAAELPARLPKGKNSSGIGLSNINERIKTEYGGEYGIRITSAEGEGTAVEYTLPLLQWD